MKGMISESGPSYYDTRFWWVEITRDIWADPRGSKGIISLMIVSVGAMMMLTSGSSSLSVQVIVHGKGGRNLGSVHYYRIEGTALGGTEVAFYCIGFGPFSVIDNLHHEDGWVMVQYTKTPLGNRFVSYTSKD